MKDIITKLFNLEPEDIQDIEISSAEYTQFALITLKVKPQKCPRCGSYTKRIHDYYKRTIVHQIIEGANTVLVFNQRRYQCMLCNKSFSESNPFTGSGARISKYTIMRTMQLLKSPSMTFSTVANLMKVSTTTIVRIFDNHAGINTIPMPECICIDEIYAVKYKQRAYACVLVDMHTCQIFDLLPNRHKNDIACYLSAIPRQEREKVQYVCMDMWDIYRDVCSLYFPEAKICVDSFHVIKLINHAFNLVRIRVMNGYDKNSEEYRLLKRFHWLLSKSSSNINLSGSIDLRRYYAITGGRYIQAIDLIKRLLSIHPELEAAYYHKESYAYFNKTSDSKNAAYRLDQFITELSASGISEFQPVKRSLRKWRKEIVNSFNRHNGKRISNGPVESVNSRLKLIKRNGNGYKDFERFRKRALYSLNNNSTIKL